MARYKYVILSKGKDGRDQEYRDWYDNQHLQDVLAVEGVVAAERHDIDFQKVYDIEVPHYTSLTIYELESDDPQALMAHLVTLAGTDAMPMTDAADKTGMLQVIAPIREG